MIRVVQANPAIDRIEVVSQFDLGAVNRSIDVRVIAGGKGLNVARGIRRLGPRVAAYGFVGGATGQVLRGACRSLGIEDAHTEIQGETRVCFIIVEESGRSTVLNEPGPRVGEPDARALVEAVGTDARPGDVAVVSGSLPRGLPPEFYAQVIDVLRGKGVRVVLDTAGAPLRAAMPAGPWIVKANAAEIGEVIGERTSDQNPPPLAKVREMLPAATEWCVITLGARGALAVGRDHVYSVSAPVVPIVNATGSGDMFLAGLTVAVTRGSPMTEALRLAAACGAANAGVLEPDLPDLGVVHRLLDEIRVDQVGA